jgi:hypothetical protein
MNLGLHMNVSPSTILPRRRSRGFASEGGPSPIPAIMVRRAPLPPAADAGRA